MLSLKHLTLKTTRNSVITSFCNLAKFFIADSFYKLILIKFYKC